MCGNGLSCDQCGRGPCGQSSTQICTACAGRGVKYVSPMRGIPLDQRQTVRCNVCKGRGKIINK